MRHVQFMRSDRDDSKGAANSLSGSPRGSFTGLREGFTPEVQQVQTPALDGSQPAGVSSNLGSISNGRRIRDIARLRASRANYFPVDLFADPAWDILLHLYASHLDQRRECVGGIIALSGVPATTGLRWIHKLADEQLILLRDDPLDQRRKWVALSPLAVSALERFFASANAVVC